MKKRIFIFAILISLGLSVSVAVACNCGKNKRNNQTSSCSCGSSCGSGQTSCSEGPALLDQGKMNQEPKTIESKTIKIGNKICPIEGAKIGSMGKGVKVEHEGKIYNLCCAGCIQPFKRNPEKYHKIADKEVGLEDKENKVYDEKVSGDNDHNKHK